jgi:hypothetical protein
MTNAQNSFTENKSTETASQIFIENIQESISKWLYVLGYLLTSQRHMM